MPDGFAFGSITNFYFAAPLTVSPGTTYFLQPVTQPGSDDQWDVVGSANTYAGGSAFFHGTLDLTTDLWFREGIVTPEPSAAVPVMLTSGVFACFRRAHQKIIPSPDASIATSMNGGAQVNVGGDPDNIASWKFTMVFSPSGNLNYYLRGHE